MEGIGPPRGRRRHRRLRGVGRDAAHRHARQWVLVPGYAVHQDLDPAERLWAWTKYGRMANLCPRDLRHLVPEVAKALVVPAQHDQAPLDGLVRAAGLAMNDHGQRPSGR